MHVLLPNKLGAFGVLLWDSLAEASDELSLSASALLLGLFYSPGVSSTELAKIAGVSQPTAVRVLDGLCRRGLIARHGRMGRNTVLRVTAEGRKRAQRLQTARLKAMGYVLCGLSRQEQTMFEKVVDKLLAGATRSRAFARTTCRLCDHKVCDGPLCPIGTRATAIERSDNM